MANARRNEKEAATALSTSTLTIGRGVVQPKQSSKTVVDAKRRMTARPYGLTENRSGCLIPVVNVGYPPKRTYPPC
jgi:hypothetical protein